MTVSGLLSSQFDCHIEFVEILTSNDQPSTFFDNTQDDKADETYKSASLISLL
jgi:hypothetical protein